MNEDLDKAVVARRNVIENHFSDEFIRTRCEDLKQQMKLLPYTLSWLGRDFSGHSALYGMIRSMP